MSCIAGDVPVVILPIPMAFLSIVAVCMDVPSHAKKGARYMRKIGSI